MADSFLAQIDRSRVPRHVAIIMDGNGRWAKAHGNERSFGHKHGVEAVRTVLEAINELGIKYLTLYTFSEENWKRPKEEVEALMHLLVSAVENELEDLKANNIRLQVLGDLKTMPEGPREVLIKATEETAEMKGCNMILAVNYSGRSELIRAAKRLVEAQPKTIDEKLFAENLYLSNLPDPDLLIRTGGEYRISNFLLWQMAYSELYFTPTYWPDFGREELFKAIVDYQGRQRRFGLTGEQVNCDNSERQTE